MFQLVILFFSHRGSSIHIFISLPRGIFPFILCKYCRRCLFIVFKEYFQRAITIHIIVGYLAQTVMLLCSIVV